MGTHANTPDLNSDLSGFQLSLKQAYKRFLFKKLTLGLLPQNVDIGPKSESKFPHDDAVRKIGPDFYSRRLIARSDRIPYKALHDKRVSDLDAVNPLENLSLLMP